jgi:hypothetical protein
MSDPISVAALFVMEKSVYKTMPGVDCYDLARDARSFPGGVAVIAHPPCRLWGRLRHFSTADPREKELAIFAVKTVRTNGGVLEHPKGSTLWGACNLPRPGQRDKFGGWTLPILQFWFGHRAEKATWLYIVGVSPRECPRLPLLLGKAPCVVTTSRGHKRPEIKKSERSATPPALAAWLVDLARRCKV